MLILPARSNPHRQGVNRTGGRPIRIEAKSGAQVRPLFTAYLKAELQSAASRSVGDHRPFLMAARSEPGSKDGVLVLRESTLEATVYALALQLGLPET